jgi:hypothetical protein
LFIDQNSIAMNKKLQNQINAYAGFATALLVADKAKAQIMHVDVNPDTLVSADPINSGIHHYLLDVNNDAANDFDFKVNHHYTASGSIYGRTTVVSPLNNFQIRNGMYYSYPSAYAPFPQPLSQGDTINANGSWMNDPNQCIIGAWSISGPHPNLLNYSGGCGAWLPGSDKCLPFRLVQNSNYYYGWLKIEVLTRSSFLLKEYAYQLQPDIPILACDITDLSTGIRESSSPFNFSQQNNSIHISTFQKLTQANISVYDLLGKEILQQPFEGKETTITIDKKGIYFVEVNGEKGIFMKKIFIY